MSFLDVMKSRYTTKKYNSAKKIDNSTKEELMNILQLSPSSINSQPWKFIFVSDAATKQKLSGVSWLNTGKVQDSDTVVVFSRVRYVADFEQQIECELPEGAVAYYNEFIKPKTEEQIKAWLDRQVYLALGVFLSACADMGIDATPMEGIEPEQYDKLLNMERYETLAAVAIGYRAEDDFNQPSKKTKSRRAFEKVIEVVS